MIDSVSSSGELWSNNGDLEVQSDSENRHFRKTIFRPIGGAAPRNFYTRYKMSLLGHAPSGTGVPRTIFTMGVKNWLKIQRISAYNFGVRLMRVTPWNFATWCHDVPIGGHYSLYNFGGHRPLKIWEGKKRPKFGAWALRRLLFSK